METPQTMITFKTNEAKFTYRVAGIAIYNGQVLFQRGDRDPGFVFWFLPGGRAELGESAEETLRREMQEELGLEITVERLVFVIENIFSDGDNDEKFRHHEIGLYFLITFPPNAYLYCENGIFTRYDEIGDRVAFEWLPRERLPEFMVLPKVLRSRLLDLPETTTHVVNIEG